MFKGRNLKIHLIVALEETLIVSSWLNDSIIVSERGGNAFMLNCELEKFAEKIPDLLSKSCGDSSKMTVWVSF